MRINEQHIAEPGLVVLNVTAADENTVRAVMDGLQQQWATSGITPVWRTPGKAGVTARVYADIRRPGTTH
ncbi:DUF6207 family protein [Streptomyces sp. NPDC002992]|uniref:DUF6207 family protein n=1 Tax=Streptomyces sp. NPDC002992 TaxID=3154273 RepID=UPI0033AF26A0